MFGLIVFTGSSGFSNRLIRCILYLLWQLVDWHIGGERMLHQIKLIGYGVLIIICIQIPTGLYITLHCLKNGVQKEDS